MNSEVDSIVNRVLEKFVNRAKIGKEKNMDKPLIVKI